MFFFSFYWLASHLFLLTCFVSFVYYILRICLYLGVRTECKNLTKHLPLCLFCSYLESFNWYILWFLCTILIYTGCLTVLYPSLDLDIRISVWVCVEFSRFYVFGFSFIDLIQILYEFGLGSVNNNSCDIYCNLSLRSI